MNIRLLLTFFLCLLWLPSLWGQSTPKPLSQFEELTEAPAADDWVGITDVSAAKSKKVSILNFFKALPAPTTTVLGGVKRNAGGAGQLVSGIGADGSLLYSDANFQEASVVLDQLIDGSLEDPVTFERGITLEGPVKVVYEPMAGTQMDLSKAAERYTASADATLTHLGTLTEGQSYLLAIDAVGAARTVSFPTAYSPDLGTNITSVTTAENGTSYLKFTQESARMVVFGAPVQTTGSDEFVLKNAPTINTPTILGVVGFQDGVRQTFNPSSLTPGFNPGSNATDPTNPVDGDMFYRPGVGLRLRDSGSWITLGAGGGGGGGLASTDIDTSVELGNIITDETGDGAFVRANSPTFTGTVSFDILDTTTLQAGSLWLFEEEGGGAQKVELYIGSSHAADRRLGFWLNADADMELTIPQTGTVAMVNINNSWTDGVKQTFNPSNTNAGLNVGANGTDPSSATDGDLYYQTGVGIRLRHGGAWTTLGSSGGVSITGTRVPYGDGSGNLTSEAGFEYTAASDLLAVGVVQIDGTASLFSPDLGHIGFSSSVTSDDIVFDLDTNNTARVYSTTNVNAVVFDTIDVQVPSEAYDATGWNGDPSTPQKDAVRDKIESITYPLIIAASDETTAITTGTGKVTFRMPYAATLTAVRASVGTAPVGSTIIVDVNEAGTSVLSTKLSIDASEKTSTTAASAAVISDTALADDAEITIDFDQVGSSTAGAGVKVTLIVTRS